MLISKTYNLFSLSISFIIIHIKLIFSLKFVPLKTFKEYLEKSISKKNIEPIYSWPAKCLQKICIHAVLCIVYTYKIII